MNGEQATDPNVLRFEPAAFQSFSRHAASFVHPREVTDDPWLTQAEKREILASWASDARAVPDAPALRQLDNGAIVHVDNVLGALASLDDLEEAERTTSEFFRQLASPSIRLPIWVKTLWRSWPGDDDDPPPCPATIAAPKGGPLSGGGTADPGLALVA